MILVQATAERQRIAAYRQAGFAGYLIKPLRRASLAARVLAAEGAGVAAPDDERIQDERAAAEPPAAASARRRARRARVLLAEDNPINAMLARTLLVREGCRVDHVVNGDAALHALAADRYDLVLMDVRMPVMGGMDATRALAGAGRGDAGGGHDRRRLRGRPPRLPGGRDERLPGQAPVAGGPARGPGALDRRRLDGRTPPRQARVLIWGRSGPSARPAVVRHRRRFARP